jgi:hypothetical protein
MLRTFIDPNGNLQYVPPNLFTQNQIAPIIQPFLYNDPYSNSSLIITSDTNSQNDSYNSFSAFPRPIFYNNSTSYDVNNDPELRKRTVRYFFEKYSTVWLPFSFTKLQKYLVSSNNTVNFISNINEYDKESVNENKNIPSDKIEFIIDNVFGKHELLVFLDKFVRNNNVNWYDLKTKHSDKIKSDLYDKLKNHMKKIVIKQI